MIGAGVASDAARGSRGMGWGRETLLMQAVLKAMLSPFSMFASANTPRRGLTATTSKSYETT